MKMLVCGLLAFSIVAAPGASANVQVAYFEVELSGSGNYTVDYGDDRLQEGLTTAIGVDGKESATWSWKLRMLASRTGHKPVQHTSAIMQASFFGSGNVLSFSIDMGKLSEDPIGCKGAGTHRTWDGKQKPALRGDWVKYNAQFNGNPLVYGQTAVTFGARFPVSLAPDVVCYHSIFGHGEGEAFVPSVVTYPRSAFNRAIGESYSRTDPVQINVPQAHGQVVDQNQLHTVQGQVRSTVRITKISHETWAKRRTEFRKSPRFKISSG